MAGPLHIYHDFAHITDWVFDLDNTLYSPGLRLFDQIETRMTAFVMRELGLDHGAADALRHAYWVEYGTTLSGLMTRHGIDPGPYLDDVHDIDFSVLSPLPHLRQRIAALQGRRFVYTNASAPYAHTVLARLGLDGLFDGVFGIEHAGYAPKPQRAAFERVFETAGIRPARAAMFEDDPRNLRAPHEMGMRTVLIGPARDPVAHIHHQDEDLHGFLGRLTNHAAT